MSVYSNLDYYLYQFNELIYKSKSGRLQKYCADLIVKDIFSILHAVDTEIKQAYSQKSDAWAIFNENLRYYKKFGGLFPSRSAVDYSDHVITELKYIQSSVQTILHRIKNHKGGWAYYSELPILLGFLKETFNC